MFVVQQTADDTNLLLTSSDGASYSWAGKTGSADPVSAGFGTPTYYQNGTSVSWANRGQVYTALHNTTNIVSAIGVAFSSSWNSNLRIAYYTVGNPEFHFQGSIKEIIITSSSLSTADRQRVEGYLAVKYGLRASLGAGHPYKNSPPN